jgi:nicotinamide phosphoribosyltransferase
MFIKEYLLRPFTLADIEFAKDFWEMHGEPFNFDGAKYIYDQYGGYLPVTIQAVKEGTNIETSNVLVQLRNNGGEKTSWITNFLETSLLRGVWYPTSIATLSFMCKKIIYNALQLTADNPDAEILFKLHDFGFRGVSSWESAAIGGCAHLVNFMGSDTVAGVLAARNYYNEKMAGFSIPASEHSTITSWGPGMEAEAFLNMINRFGGKGKLYACVSDSYDIWNAVENIWPSLKDAIIEKGGTLVVRPDSGNPVAVVAGVIERLMSKFGWTENSKGYRVLPEYIRVIQGDGIDEESIRDILQELQFRKISASNVAFGMGGALLQHLNRDTLRFAMKCNSIKRNGSWQDVSKNPVTDSGKVSKAGRLALIKIDPEKEGRRGEPYFKTIREDELGDRENCLETVFENGELMREQSFSEIRELAASSL